MGKPATRQISAIYMVNYVLTLSLQSGGPEFLFPLVIKYLVNIILSLYPPCRLAPSLFPAIPHFTFTSYLQVMPYVFN